MGTQQMALPPHVEEMGMQLLPVVTSLGSRPPAGGIPGPGRLRRRDCFPFPKVGCALLHRFSWGTGSSREVVSCKSPFGHVCGYFAWFLFKLLGESFPVQTSTCALSITWRIRRDGYVHGESRKQQWEQRQSREAPREQRPRAQRADEGPDLSEATVRPGGE